MWQAAQPCCDRCCHPEYDRRRAPNMAAAIPPTCPPPNMSGAAPLIWQVLYDSRAPPAIARIEPRLLPLHQPATFDVHASNLHPATSAGGLTCRFSDGAPHLPY
eukprot:4137570-Prymnesium_polylepis.1